LCCLFVYGPRAGERSMCLNVDCPFSHVLVVAIVDSTSVRISPARDEPIVT
jgi:hypothetical protein